MAQEFTPPLEAIIQAATSAAVQQLTNQQQQDQVSAEIRNRVLDVQNSQPGHQYY